MHRVPGYPHLEQRVLPSLHGPCCSAWLHARLWSADCIWSSLVDLRGMKVCVVRTCKCVQSCFSCVRLFTTLWTVACQALLPMGFSRQEYWNGLPCPPPGDLPDPGIEPESLASPVLVGGFFTTGATWEAHVCHDWCSNLQFGRAG